MRTLKSRGGDDVVPALRCDFRRNSTTPPPHICRPIPGSSPHSTRSVGAASNRRPQPANARSTSRRNYALVASVPCITTSQDAEKRWAWASDRRTAFGPLLINTTSLNNECINAGVSRDASPVCFFPLSLSPFLLCTPTWNSEKTRS